MFHGGAQPYSGFCGAVHGREASDLRGLLLDVGEVEGLPVKIYCSKCEAANAADADVCGMCGHHLKQLATTPTEVIVHRLESMPVVSAKALPLIVRPTRRRRRVIAGSLLFTIMFSGAAYSVYWSSLGTLPSPDEIEQRLDYWAMQERPEIIRGRPLIEIPFTCDASKTLGQPLFSIYVDEARRPLAFSGWMIDVPDESFGWLLKFVAREQTKEYPNDLSPLQRYWGVRTFASEFLSGVTFDLGEVLQSAASGRIRLIHDTTTQKSDGLGQQYRQRVIAYTSHRYEVSVTIVDQEKGDSNDEDKGRDVLWIVKSRDW